MTLPTANLDDRTWADLTQEGISLIPRFAPEWTDFNIHDPGVTLVELLAYRAEQELYRLNTVGAAHRHAFLSLFGKRFLLKGPRCAATLLVYEPCTQRAQGRLQVNAGDCFKPWDTPLEPENTGTINDPPGVRRPAASARVTAPPVTADSLAAIERFWYRAAHAMNLTGIRIGRVQSFDGRRYVDLTDLVAHGRPAAVWGDAPAAPDALPPEQQPAFYIGFDVKLRLLGLPLDSALTLWFMPEGDAKFPHDWLGYHRPSSGQVPRHHGFEVVWEYLSATGWRSMPDCRDETCGFTRPGRVILSLSIFPSPDTTQTSKQIRAVGVAPSAQFYVRCRLACGMPDAAPALVGIYADAVLVEQARRAETVLRPGMRNPTAQLTLRDLQLDPVLTAEFSDFADEFVARGWSASVSGWGQWPVSARTLGQILPSAQALGAGPAMAPFVVLGVGTGEPGQRFDLPCRAPDWEKSLPGNNTNDPSTPQILGDDLEVWSMEPFWSWRPDARPTVPAWRERHWQRVPDLVLCGRRTAGYRLDRSANQVVFGDGEASRVIPPGAVVVAAYEWTAADAGNLSANMLWAKSDDPALSQLTRLGVTPTISFRNPLPASSGTPAEELPHALSRLAAEFGASENLIAAADQSTTFDGFDLPDQPSPHLAVTLLDFESLARSVPGTSVARARAWAEVDPQQPGMVVPGVVTLIVLPSLPADRPTPTPALLLRVADHLEARRPVACRVIVTGPQYQDLRVQATLHVAAGAGPSVKDRAAAALKQFLHPLTGGPGRGWPFGRPVHAGELMRVLGEVEGVRGVTDLQLAAGTNPWALAMVVPPLGLPALTDLVLNAKEDA